MIKTIIKNLTDKDVIDIFEMETYLTNQMIEAHLLYIRWKDEKTEESIESYWKLIALKNIAEKFWWTVEGLVL